jgi:molybdopterin-synthase adenylyltransferase
MKTLNAQELERCRRQMMLEGFSREHQGKLKNSTVLVAGIGGLGGTAAAYLAVAGIGKMVFAHSGDLTLSNMNRQIIMKHDWIGKSRVMQGKETIREINPDVEVEVWDARTTENIVDAFLDGADIALSARPTFHERRELNKGCVRKGIPMVEAAMNGMEGYLFNVVPGKTPCLNCLYPEDDPSWKELGFPVLGAVSGMLGCLMAIEAIKLLTGFRKPLLNKMLHFDTAGMDFKKLSIHRDENCKVCGKAPIGQSADN